MTPVLIAYLAVLGWWGARARRRSVDTPSPDTPTRDFDEFTVAGRTLPVGAVALSMIATVLGASATLGVADEAAARGPVAFLWLATAAVGLGLQSRLFAHRVRATRARTLPEIAGQCAGRAGQRLIAGVIVLAWIGVVAAQLKGLGAVLSALYPAAADGGAGLSLRWGVGLAAAVVTLYAAVGGQRAVVRTDGLQAIWLYVSLMLTVGWLLAVGMPTVDPSALAAVPETTTAPAAPRPWTGWDFARVGVLWGGAFVVGPDLFSRHATARDPSVARRATAWAAAAMVPAGVLITVAGCWVGAHRGAGDSTSALPWLLGGMLPEGLTALLAVGLAGALLSSADTCLVSVATMVEVDLCGRTRTNRARGWTVAAGVASWGVAWISTMEGGPDIMGLLLGAYSVYVPGVAGPVGVALWTRGRRLSRGRWLAAVATGGLCGLAGEVSGRCGWLTDPWARPGLALLGVVLGLGLAIRAVGPKETDGPSDTPPGR